MKIAVNLHCLTPPLTGVGHYSLELARRLQNHPEVEELAGLSQQGWHSAEEVSEVLASDAGYGNAPGVSEQSPTGSGVSGNSILDGFVKPLARKIPGLRAMRDEVHRRRRYKLGSAYAEHIYWEPNYILMPVDNPAVVTVHDLSHLHFPEFHPKERLQELERLPDSIRRARRLVAVSEFTRSEMVRGFSLDPEKISVVSPSVGPEYTPASSAFDEELRQSLSLPERFCLTVGTLEPRKNLPLLLEAFNSLPADLQNAFPLVIAGGWGWRCDAIEKALSKCDPRIVRTLGYVEGSWLPSLYRMASVLAYPSLYEGFGMPVLEAMASGTPVVTSNAASLPEVSAGAAELADPNSVADIAGKLERVLGDAQLRATLAERGLEIVRQHSWERSAQRLVNGFAGIQW